MVTYWNKLLLEYLLWKRKAEALSLSREGRQIFMVPQTTLLESCPSFLFCCCFPVCFLVWGHNQQWLGLIPPLCSKIIPGSVWGPYVIPRIELRLVAWKAGTLTLALSLRPQSPVCQRGRTRGKQRTWQHRKPVSLVAGYFPFFYYRSVLIRPRWKPQSVF